MENKQGIILRTNDLGENDKLIKLFTTKGIFTCKVRGVRKNNSKLKPYVNVLTFGEFSFAGKDNSLLVSGIQCIENFYDAWENWDRISAALFCCELTEKTFLNDEDTENSFVFLLKNLKEIVYGKSKPVIYVLYYMLFCVRNLGIDYSEIKNLHNEIYSIMELISSVDISEINTLSFTEKSILNALIVLNSLFKNHTGFELKSFNSLLKSND